MSKGLINGFAREVHSRAECLIESEVWCNDTRLVEALLQIEFLAMFTIEHIENLFRDEPAGGDPEIQEIFEWWRVSHRLARMLKQIGEPILENPFGCWWGRTCTGQAIAMDGTIQSLLVARASGGLS